VTTLTRRAAETVGKETPKPLRGNGGNADRLASVRLLRVRWFGPRGQHFLDKREEDVTLLLVEGVTPGHPSRSLGAMSKLSAIDWLIIPARFTRSVNPFTMSRSTPLLPRASWAPVISAVSSTLITSRLRIS
jgi:hypothetical protein